LEFGLQRRFSQAIEEESTPFRPWGSINRKRQQILWLMVREDGGSFLLIQRWYCGGSLSIQRWYYFHTMHRQITLSVVSGIYKDKSCLGWSCSIERTQEIVSLSTL
jgi:hypothetical protein